MNTPANYTTRASHSSSVPVQETSYLSCLEGRIGYDVAGSVPWWCSCPAWVTCGPATDPAERRLGEVTAPALVVMGEQDPDFPDPRAEAGWIARALHAQVVMVPDAGHYPQSQRPDITTGAVLSFLESVNGPAQAGLTQPSMPEEAGRIAGEVTQSRGPEVTAASSPAPPLPGPTAQ